MKDWQFEVRRPVSEPVNPSPLIVSDDDPLVLEHKAVAAWVEDALETLGEHDYYRELDLKSLPSGQAILAGNPEASRRLVIAAVAQVRHWDRLAEAVRSQGADEMARINEHLLPGWAEVWGRRRQAHAVIQALMRRTLPFDQADLLALLEWCNESEQVSIYHYPIGQLVRALQRFSAGGDLPADVGNGIRRFAMRLRSSHDKDVKRFGTALEQLCSGEPAGGAQETSALTQPPARPAPAGTADVLIGMKRMMGMLPPGAMPATEVLEPDRFACPVDSPLRDEHELLNALFREVVATRSANSPGLHKFASGRQLLGLDAPSTGRALLAAAERHINLLIPATYGVSEAPPWQTHSAAAGAAVALLNRDFQLDRNGTIDLLLYLTVMPSHLAWAISPSIPKLIANVAGEAAASPLTEGERFVLSLFRISLVTGPALGSPSDEVAALTTLINDGATFYLTPGEVWTDTVNAEFPGLPADRRLAWVELFRHALTATAARPSAKWLKTAEQLLAAIGGDPVRETLARWLPLVCHGQSIRKLVTYFGDSRDVADLMHPENADCLRGLLWCVPLLPQREALAREVTAVALSAYKKEPGIGPRAVKVGNAAVFVLSTFASKEAVGQLAMLKVRVKFGTAQKEIEKAFDVAASALSLARDEVEELGVPSYGLEEVGRRCETLGDYRAELVASGADAELRWFDAAGKQLKSVPAKIKANHKEDLKELQQSLKDVQAMLPAQRDRIDGMFLLEKSWPIAQWRERYHDHPLVGTIAQRLLWRLDGTPVLFRDGVATDIEGNPVPHGLKAEITLWHPVGRSIAEITAWRRRLEELRITQPFKQAHREVYLLTDAERNTETYSNRFAAHIIRQHQFNALCSARGWKNKLRLMVDDCYPPASKDLPPWGLRAEFWVEGVGDDFGVDTNDSGTYLRLATDQVRFYRTGAAGNLAHASGGGYESRAIGPGREDVNAPLSLDEVPALVFSEIMRDVDLFVGVASVGNDPTWQDGGPGGRYREYWQHYSFGELSGSAITRKQVLERLIPRMKIASRCSLSDRFLVVRGDKRVYRIHLGSGNILMEPNDQYLCIVPNARARASEGDLYLPFDGDATLSIIISKALLLADDAKIKDLTITRQIDAG